MFLLKAKCVFPIKGQALCCTKGQALYLSCGINFNFRRCALLMILFLGRKPGQGKERPGPGYGLPVLPFITDRPTRSQVGKSASLCPGRPSASSRPFLFPASARLFTSPGWAVQTPRRNASVRILYSAAGTQNNTSLNAMYAI